MDTVELKVITLKDEVALVSITMDRPAVIDLKLRAALKERGGLRGESFHFLSCLDPWIREPVIEDFLAYLGSGKVGKSKSPFIRPLDKSGSLKTPKVLCLYEFGASTLFFESFSFIVQ